MRQVWIGTLALLTGVSVSAGVAFKGPGNATVFPVADPVKQVTLSNLSGAAEWTVSDFWQHPVAKGVLKSGENTLSLPLTEPGYYRLVVRCGQETTEVGVAVVAPPPALRKDSPFGVNTHFAQGWETSLIPLIRAAGFSWIRDGLEWQSVEPRKGEFDFSFEVARRVLKASEELNMVYGLAYGNQYYDQRSAPVTPEGIAGWKGYVAATMAAHPKVTTYETWNEYNCGFNMFGKVRPTPENYMLLLKATHEKVRRNRSGYELVGCSATTLPFEWLEQVFALGGLDYMDVVSVHPYRWGEWQKPPETLYPDLLRLRQLVDKYAKGRRIPIYATELGWPVDWKYRISDAKQAAYIVRTFANLQRAGVARTLWYCFMKPPQDPELFAIGDLVPDWNYAPRPGYAAIATMTREVAEAQYVGDKNVPAPALCMKFRKGNKSVYMLWNPDVTPVTLAVGTSGPLPLIDIMGGRHLLTPVGGKVQLMLAQFPVYLEGEIGDVTLSNTITASPAAMETAVNTPFQFRLAGDAAFALATDGKEFRPGQTVSLEENDRIGTRNAIGAIRHGGVDCGFFCFSYDVLTQLSLAHIQLQPEQRIRVDINNILPAQPQKLTGFSGEFDGVKLTPPPLETLAAAPVTSLFLPFSKPVGPYDLKPVAMQFDFSSHPALKFAGMLGNNPCFFRNDITVDGNVGEWRNQPCINLRTQGKYVVASGSQDAGPEKFNGKVWVAWDEKRFYLAAEVVDVTHKQVFPVWDGDSIQLGIGKVFPADTDTSIEVELAFSAANGDSWVFPGRGPLGFDGGAIRQYSEPKMKHQGNVSTYEVAIPWDKIRFVSPRDGSFRFSILVNNNNGEGRLGWLEWGAGIGSDKNPELYQVMTFVKPAGAK
jgi:hypothetical protein